MSTDIILNAAAFGAGLVVMLITRDIISRIKRHRAAKRASMQPAPWHVVDIPVHDPDTGALLGWVPTRSDTGEVLPEAIYGLSNPYPALGDQKARKVPQNGAQGRTGASS